MKRIANIYEGCRVAIIIALFGCVLSAFGFLIQNESVNIFYTFRSSFILTLAEGLGNLGKTILLNLPLIFMVNIVCKRANSGYPIIIAILGYFSFLIATSLFASTGLAQTAYSTNVGINSIFNIQNGTKYPLECGLLGSFIVGYITRFSYIKSRHKTPYSLLGFLNKDALGIVYNVVLCSIAGILVALIYPFFFNNIQKAINYIADNKMDPVRIGLYGVLDRVLSMLGLGNIVRQPFWFSALGGTHTVAGQTIVGDVNIWNVVRNGDVSYIGAGRFITPYYVINFFVVPAIYIGLFMSVSDKKERNHYIFGLIAAIILSVICGNPLPMELLLLFTSPLLLVFYLFVVFVIFYVMSYSEIYLGSNLVGANIVSAMPGNFPDFIINLRNITYSSMLNKIVYVGLGAFFIMFVASLLYYRYIAYDIARAGKAKSFAASIIDAVGGKDNVVSCESGLFRVNVKLNDLEKVSIEKIKNMKVRRVTETKEGIDLICGSSAYVIARKVRYLVTGK